MATKIETSLSPEALMKLFGDLARTKGGATGPAIRAVCALHGVVISHETANQYRKPGGVVAKYLADLAANTQRAKDIVTIANGGIGLADAAAVKLAVKINDDLDAAGTLSVDEKTAYSLSIARLRAGDVRARDLERKLIDSEAARDNAAQRLQLLQFDAVSAVLKQTSEIRAIVNNPRLGDTARRERVRTLLFGAPPADFKPIPATGAQPEAGEETKA